MSLISACGKQRQGDVCEFEFNLNLIYIASFRPASKSKPSKTSMFTM